MPVPADPIGIFDSGLGGLTVARALIDVLPDERFVYFGDTGRFPYGPKPAEEVLKYALEIADVERRLAQVRAETVRRRRDRVQLVRQMVEEVLRGAQRPE